MDGDSMPTNTSLIITRSRTRRVTVILEQLKNAAFDDDIEIFEALYTELEQQQQFILKPLINFIYYMHSKNSIYYNSAANGDVACFLIKKLQLSDPEVRSAFIQTNLLLYFSKYFYNPSFSYDDVMVFLFELPDLTFLKHFIIYPDMHNKRVLDYVGQENSARLPDLLIKLSEIDYIYDAKEISQIINFGNILAVAELIRAGYITVNDLTSIPWSFDHHSIAVILAAFIEEGHDPFGPIEPQMIPYYRNILRISFEQGYYKLQDAIILKCLNISILSELVIHPIAGKTYLLNSFIPNNPAQTYDVAKFVHANLENRYSMLYIAIAGNYTNAVAALSSGLKYWLQQVQTQVKAKPRIRNVTINGKLVKRSELNGLLDLAVAINKFELHLALPLAVKYFNLPAVVYLLKYMDFLESVTKVSNSKQRNLALSEAINRSIRFSNHSSSQHVALQEIIYQLTVYGAKLKAEAKPSYQHRRIYDKILNRVKLWHVDFTAMIKLPRDLRSHIMSFVGYECLDTAFTARITTSWDRVRNARANSCAPNIISSEQPHPERKRLRVI